MKFKILNALVVFSILVSLSTGSSVALEEEFERYSGNCDIPSDVAYCMDVMRVGTRFSDETAEHFVRLETQLSEHALDECSWESFEGKKSPKECISTLSRFAEEGAEEDAEEDAALVDMSNDLDVSEHILDKVCYKACKLVKCLKCKFKFPKKKRKKCKKKCKRKCRKKCDKLKIKL